MSDPKSKRERYDEARLLVEGEKTRCIQQVLSRVVEMLNDAASIYSQPSPLHKHIYKDFTELIAWHARYGTMPE